MLKPQRVTNHSLYRYAGGKNRMKKDLIKIIRDVNPGIEYLVSPFWVVEALRC